jgi:uncharacterized protein YndB with AHSA1/START domain
VRPVTLAATIAAPPAAVLAYVADTRKDPEWCPNVDSAELVSGDGTSPGSVFRYRQHLTTGRRKVEFEGETTVVERTENSITWLVADRFQQRRITLQVEPHGDGTRITQVTQASFLRPPGIMRWLYPLGAKRILRKQFAHLAKRFE